MPSPNAIAPPPSTARFHFSTVNSRLFCSNSFRITYIHKMAPANPYGSHISKTKDLKPFRITYFQKSGRVGGRAFFASPDSIEKGRSVAALIRHPTSNLQPPGVKYSYVCQTHRH